MFPASLARSLHKESGQILPLSFEWYQSVRVIVVVVVVVVVVSSDQVRSSSDATNNGIGRKRAHR